MDERRTRDAIENPGPSLSAAGGMPHLTHAAWARMVDKRLRAGIADGRDWGQHPDISTGPVPQAGAGVLNSARRGDAYRDAGKRLVNVHHRQRTRAQIVADCDLFGTPERRHIKVAFAHPRDPAREFNRVTWPGRLRNVLRPVFSSISPVAQS